MNIGNLHIEENVPLAPLTTFFIGGNTRYLARVATVDALRSVVDFAESAGLQLFMLGSGSNILVADAGFPGVAVVLETAGKDIIFEDEHEVLLQISGGETWDDVVWYVCMRGWWGIENLSHIPGKMGAFVMQNVGAYGQEAGQVVERVEVFDRIRKVLITFSNAECNFGYRTSIFNTAQRGRYVILSVIIRLQKKSQPNLSYADVRDYLTHNNKEITLENIRHAIISIRDQKFPYPTGAKNGSAGSFFRGTVLDTHGFQNLIDIVRIRVGQAQADRLASMHDRLAIPQGFKTPGAFLLDICGQKGRRVGGALINPKQPAIILNESGEATAADVLQLFREARQEVFEKTGVSLEMEPELVGFDGDQKL